MAVPEARIVYVEGQVNELSKGLSDVRADFRDVRTDIREMRTEIHRLDDKVSRQFLWMVGIQITILVAVLGAVLSRGI